MGTSEVDSTNPSSSSSPPFPSGVEYVPPTVCSELYSGRLWFLPQLLLSDADSEEPAMLGCRKLRSETSKRSKRFNPSSITRGSSSGGRSLRGERRFALEAPTESGIGRSRLAGISISALAWCEPFVAGWGGGRRLICLTAATLGSSSICFFFLPETLLISPPMAVAQIRIPETLLISPMAAVQISSALF